MTTEIATYPPGSDLESFAWRASIAEVASDGPFSSFPGVDRVFVLLSGRGVRIRGEAGTIDLRACFEPVRFAGDAALGCELVDGPVRDFNLMLRRDRARGSLAVIREGARTLEDSRFTLCHVVSGASRCVASGELPVTVRAGQTLLLEQDAPNRCALRIASLAPDTVVLVAAIELP